MLDALCDATPVVAERRWRCPPIRALAAFYAAPLALLTAVVAVRAWTGTPIAYFTRDPAALLGGSPFAGVVSQCGAILWCAAAACCLFAWAVVRRRGLRGPDSGTGFLLGAGVLSTLLLADDQFELHEGLAGSPLHVPEVVVYALYATALVALLWQHRDLVRHSEYALLAAAIGLFGVSAAADIALPRDTPLHYLVEDGSKFLGIAGWLAYLARTALAIVTTFATTGLGVAPEAPRFAGASLTRRTARQAAGRDDLNDAPDLADLTPSSPSGAFKGFTYRPSRNEPDRRARGRAAPCPCGRTSEGLRSAPGPRVRAWVCVTSRGPGRV